MTLLKQIMRNEVYPAVGCTEPIACAYGAAVAAENLGEPVTGVDLKVDAGTCKNGAAAVVPNSNGLKGNSIAAAMGAVLARSALRLELLREATPAVVERARQLLEGGACSYASLPDSRDFRVEVALRGASRTARCVLSEGHANIERIEQNGRTVFDRHEKQGADRNAGYRDRLKAMRVGDLLEAVTSLDKEDRRTLRRGIEMNLALAEHGYEVRHTAYRLRRMKEQGIVADDLFYRVKVCVASAVDARMAGVSLAAMTSGGSGNQGIVAILTPYLVGQARGAATERIIESIAAAHAINAYVKCHVGELSVICGCAMAAGIAAAVAIVYQHAGVDREKVTLAVNNVIGDLSGLICDGAKPGCSMKTVTSVDAAMRAAFMAIDGFGLSVDDGIVGRTAEKSIRNLGRLTLEGMTRVDPTVVDILIGKTAADLAAPDDPARQDRAES
jgi:L-cysteine desulfidase